MQINDQTPREYTAIHSECVADAIEEALGEIETKLDRAINAARIPPYDHRPVLAALNWSIDTLIAYREGINIGCGGEQDDKIELSAKMM